MVDVKVIGGEMSQAEIDAYVDRARQKYPDTIITGMDAGSPAILWAPWTASITASGPRRQTGSSTPAAA